MKFSVPLVKRRPSAPLEIVRLILTIAPLWLVLAVVPMSALAQLSGENSSPSTSATTTPSPADWTEFLRDNMQRWNPYETVLGVNNVGTLGLKWSYFDYIRISGTPGLGACTTPRYQGTGQIVCHENSSMAPNTTWTVRLTVKVTAPAGTVITENAATMSDTPDPNMANNMATASTTVQ